MSGAYQFDVLIIGSGIAGLSSAIKLGESGLKVGILTREKDPRISNTFWAQGGIIYPINETDDKSKNLVGDIDRASSYTANLEAAEILQKKSPKIVEELLLNKAKTNFKKNSNGELDLTREAAHSIERILYQGDVTAKDIHISLLN